MSYKIFMNNTGSPESYLRGWSVSQNLCVELLADGIDLRAADPPTMSYDAFVFYNAPPRQYAPLFQVARDRGKKIVWDVSEDVFNLPSWYPGDVDLTLCDWLRHNADEVWVATERLRSVIGRGTVLPTLVDVRYWPDVHHPVNDRLRIVWAGGWKNLANVELVMGVFDRLLARYADIQCLIFGQFPESSGQWVRFQGSNHGILVPQDKYGGRLGFVEPVGLAQYPMTLTNLNGDIGICGLTDEAYNLARGNLKWVEYTLAGMACVTSQLPPYLDTLSMQGDDLYETCCKLIETDGLVRVLKRDAREEVTKNWTWDGPKRQLWLDAIRSLHRI